MAEIRPFRGIIYNTSKAGGDFSDVVAPPYDVISDAKREELHEKSEYNIIRLILGMDKPGDDDSNNKYTRARRLFDDWQEKGVLQRDAEPALYVYEQQYDFKGKTVSRVGFLGLMKIGEAPGNDDVLPHEYTLSKPKEDRLNLIKQVETNLSPVFSLYDDGGGVVTDILKSVRSDTPILDIGMMNQRHIMWRLTDPDAIDKVCAALAGKKVFIADGHHRYEVSRSYRNLLRAQEGYDGSADYVMMYFADMTSSDNLTVMATHRVMKKMPFDMEQVLDKLGRYFDITEKSGLKALVASMEEADDNNHVFGYYSGGKYLSMKPKSEEELQSMIAEERSRYWKELDVSILHSGILKSILGIDSAEGDITYVRDAEEAEELVNDGSHEAAFILNPTRVGQLTAVAELGEMMPQKSTYFYPKLLTGLVVNKVDCQKQGCKA